MTKLQTPCEIKRFRYNQKDIEEEIDYYVKAYKKYIKYTGKDIYPFLEVENSLLRLTNMLGCINKKLSLNYTLFTSLYNMIIDKKITSETTSFEFETSKCCTENLTVSLDEENEESNDIISIFDLVM